MICPTWLCSKGSETRRDIHRASKVLCTFTFLHVGDHSKVSQDLILAFASLQMSLGAGALLLSSEEPGSSSAFRVARSRGSSGSSSGRRRSLRRRWGGGEEPL